MLPLSARCCRRSGGGGVLLAEAAGTNFITSRFLWVSNQLAARCNGQRICNSFSSVHVGVYADLLCPYYELFSKPSSVNRGTPPN